MKGGEERNREECKHLNKGEGSRKRSTLAEGNNGREADAKANNELEEWKKEKLGKEGESNRKGGEEWRNELLVEENRCVRVRIRRGGGGRINVRMVYTAGLRASRMFPALFRIYGFHYCWLVVVGYTRTTATELSKLKLAARLHFMSKFLRAHKNPKSRTGHPYIHPPFPSHLQLVGHPPCPPPGRKVTSRATHDHAPTTRYNRACNPELHPLLPSTLRCEVKEKSRTLFHPSSILLEISTNDLCRRGMSFLLSSFVAKSTFFPPFSSTT